MDESKLKSLSHCGASSFLDILPCTMYASECGLPILYVIVGLNLFDAIDFPKYLLYNLYPPKCI